MFAHIPPPFSIYKATNKAVSIPLPCLFYLMSFFFRRSLQGHGMLFTLISSYLWAQLRLMLQVWCSLAVAFYSFRWRGEMVKKKKKTAKKSEAQSHLRGEMITLTRSGGPMQSSVKLVHETEWWHTAVFCPHSIHIHTFYSCRWSGAIGSGNQMPNMLSVPLGAWWQRHARHKQKMRQNIHPAV